MAKNKIAYVCIECGGESSKWQGQCPHCHAWNTMQEQVINNDKSPRAERFTGYAGGTSRAKVQDIAEIDLEEAPRFSTGIAEFDRVLGGGLVPGMVALCGGEPGIGKSTLLLQTLSAASQHKKTLYVTGEESPQQVAARERRLGLSSKGLRLVAETEVESILRIAQQEQPEIMVIDSIQTMYLAEITSAPGSVSQVRECAAHITRFAKQTGTAVLLVGHVTKEGGIAGPRVLEHIVDAVVFLEGKSDSRYRMMRAMKNRFGAVNELGIFAMGERGMVGVANPSAIFLARAEEPAPGSLVTVVWEGSRPLLVEMQSLVDDSQGNPRRVAVGVDANRVNMLLAVLNRHSDLQMGGMDNYLNVVGGVKITETSADLAVLLATVSSFRKWILPQDMLVFGEVGLTGEIRPVSNGPERLKEAAKHGFKRAIIPKANLPKGGVDGMKIKAVKNLQEAIAALHYSDE